MLFFIRFCLSFSPVSFPEVPWARTGSHGCSNCQGGWESKHLTLQPLFSGRVSTKRDLEMALDSVAAVEGALHRLLFNRAHGSALTEQLADSF